MKSFYDQFEKGSNDQFVKEYNRVIEKSLIINIIINGSTHQFLRNCKHSMYHRPIYSYHLENQCYMAPLLQLLKMLTGHKDLLIYQLI